MFLFLNSLDGGDNVDTDDLVRVSSKESGSISRPGQTSAVGGTGMSSSLLALVEFLGSQGINDNLGFQIPDLDAFISGGTQPVPVGGEDKGVDDFTGIKTVKALALVKVPKHGSSVLSSGGTEGAIGGNAHGVEVSSVSNKVVAELAVGQGPDLHETIPSAGDDEGNRLGRAESDAGDPFGVTFGISSDGVLALSEGVPKFDGLITGSRDDLTVVNTEGNTQDILGVTDETTGGASGVDLPKTEGSIPGSRKGELTITGDDNVTDEVGVSAKGTLGVSVGIILTGAGVGKAPDKDGLITGSGKDEVGVLGGGGDGGDPITVALKGSTEAQSFGHGGIILGLREQKVSVVVHVTGDARPSCFGGAKKSSSGRHILI